jgi:hypothetical protein
MHDTKNNTYEIAIDGEIVTVPSELFHKLFREKTPMSIFGLQRESWPSVLKDSYDDMRLGVRMWIDGGKTVEEVKKMARAYYQDAPKPVLDMMDGIIDKLFEEETKDKERKD